LPGYGVPPPLVQDYSHNTFTNSQEASRWFASNTLTPWVRKFEAEARRSLFTAAAAVNHELQLDMSDLLRGSPLERCIFGKSTRKSARHVDCTLRKADQPPLEPATIFASRGPAAGTGSSGRAVKEAERELDAATRLADPHPPESLCSIAALVLAGVLIVLVIIAAVLLIAL
jgi:Phage portal protein